MTGLAPNYLSVDLWMSSYRATAAGHGDVAAFLRSAYRRGIDVIGTARSPQMLPESVKDEIDYLVLCQYDATRKAVTTYWRSRYSPKRYNRVDSTLSMNEAFSPDYCDYSFTLEGLDAMFDLYDLIRAVSRQVNQ